MGIDLLDVSFRLEKYFPLKLDREFWDGLYQEACRRSGNETPDVTVQQIFEELVRRLKLIDRYEESGAGLIEAIRREVIEKLRILFPDAKLTPECRLRELSARQLSRDDWRSFQALFSITKTRSHASGVTAVCMAMGVFAFPAALGMAKGLDVSLWIAGALAMLVIGIVVGLSMWRDSRQFPPSIQTIEDLAAAILESRTQTSLIEKPSPNDKVPQRYSDELIWFSLRSVLVDALGVDDDEVTPTARLLHDLGAS